MLLASILLFDMRLLIISSIVFLLFAGKGQSAPIPPQLDPSRIRDADTAELGPDELKELEEMREVAHDYGIHLKGYRLQVYFNEINSMVGWLLTKWLLLPSGKRAIHLGYVGPAPGYEDLEGLVDEEEDGVVADPFPLGMQVEWLRHLFENLQLYANNDNNENDQPAVVGLSVVYKSREYELLKRVANAVGADRVCWVREVVDWNLSNSRGSGGEKTKRVELRILRPKSTPKMRVNGASLPSLQLAFKRPSTTNGSAGSAEPAANMHSAGAQQQQRHPRIVDSVDLKEGSPLAEAYDKLLVGSNLDLEGIPQAHLYLNEKGSIAGWARYKTLYQEDGSAVCHHLTKVDIAPGYNADSDNNHGGFGGAQLTELVRHLFDYLAAAHYLRKGEGKVLEKGRGKVAGEMGLSAAPGSPEMDLLKEVGGSTTSWQKLTAWDGKPPTERNGGGIEQKLLRNLLMPQQKLEIEMLPYELDATIVDASQLRGGPLALAYSQLLAANPRYSATTKYRHHLYAWPEERVLGWARYHSMATSNGKKRVHHLVEVGPVPGRRDFPALFPEAKQVALVRHLFEHLELAEPTHDGLSAASESRAYALLRRVAEEMGPQRAVLVGDRLKEKRDAEGKKVPQIWILFYKSRLERGNGTSPASPTLSSPISPSSVVWAQSVRHPLGSNRRSSSLNGMKKVGGQA